MSLTLSADSSVDVVRLSDAALQAGLAECARERREIEARAARFAAEIDRRSRRELGHRGLAQQKGLKSGAELVKRITGGTTRQARTLVDVGSLLAGEDAAATRDPMDVEAEGFAADSPWLCPLTAAVRAGDLDLEAARAIRAGLGEPSATVPAGRLEAAADRLVAVAGSTDADRLGRLARLERDDIDAAGVAEREAARYEKRYLKLTPADDGMTRITGLLDPESAAMVKGAFDRVLSPRRGGPRFVDPDEAAQAETLLNDPRSTDQLALDAFVQMIRLAIDADPGAMFGKWEPGVRVHVAHTELETGNGRGYLEGESAAVSIPTVKRIACTQGVLPISFDDNAHVLNLGREQRLFTRRQRIALAARDGGCRAPDCDAPPSWTEAHHILEWLKHFGRTDLADGILLCRFHHTMVHAHDYQITRHPDGSYWLQPPPGGQAPGAPPGTPIPLPTKNRVRQRAEARAQ